MLGSLVAAGLLAYSFYTFYHHTIPNQDVFTWLCTRQPAGAEDQIGGLASVEFKLTHYPAKPWFDKESLGAYGGW
jgi:hypothetical protein